MSNTPPLRGEAAEHAEQPGAQVPDLFPFARLPLWFMLAGRPLKERAVLEFLIAHINEQTGQLTAYPGIAAIGEVVGLKDRAVQYAIDGLIEFGAVEVVPTYRDWKSRERTFEPVTDGKSNAQDSNTYVPCLAPPGGMFWEGPITLQEWYDERRKDDPHKGPYKRLIEKRIAEARRREARVRRAGRRRPDRGVHADAPPSDQGFPEDPQETGGCTGVHRGGASGCTGGVHPDAPKEDQGEEDQGEGSVRPDADAGARERTAGAADADGRTESPPPRHAPPAAADAAASAAAADGLLAEPEIAQGLQGLDCRPTQRAALAARVAAVLADGYREDQVRGYLLAKMSETTAKRITFVIRAFEPARIADLAVARPMPHADERADERAARRAARDRAPAEPASAPSTGPAPSPVDWLDDRQYAALSPAERGLVNATAGSPEADLSKFQREGLHRIRLRVGASTA
uniref:hypothetical protein n=1 Tax=Amycolatopsis sp. CA-096443 TaxID=3239919 RepID=UPI003F493CDC